MMIACVAVAAALAGVPGGADCAAPGPCCTPALQQRCPGVAGTTVACPECPASVKDPKGSCMCPLPPPTPAPLATPEPLPTPAPLPTPPPAPFEAGVVAGFTIPDANVTSVSVWLSDDARAGYVMGFGRNAASDGVLSLRTVAVEWAREGTLNKSGNAVHELHHEGSMPFNEVGSVSPTQFNKVGGIYYPISAGLWLDATDPLHAVWARKTRRAVLAAFERDGVTYLVALDGIATWPDMGPLSVTIADARRPDVLLSNTSIETSCTRFSDAAPGVYADGFAYLGTYVVDVRDVRNVSVVHNFNCEADNPEKVLYVTDQALDTARQLLFFIGGGDKFLVYDVRNPAAPRLVKTFPHYPYLAQRRPVGVYGSPRVQLIDEFLFFYAGNTVSVMDVRDLDRVRIVATVECTTRTDWFVVTSFQVVRTGDLYVAATGLGGRTVYFAALSRTDLLL